jgi:hypothetical protein
VGPIPQDLAVLPVLAAEPQLRLAAEKNANLSSFSDLIHFGLIPDPITDGYRYRTYISFNQCFRKQQKTVKFLYNISINIAFPRKDED